jgi:hypothetical protein
VGCQHAIIGPRSPVTIEVALHVMAAAAPHVITGQVGSSGTAANHPNETAVHGGQRHRASHNPTEQWPRPGRRL